MPTRQARSPFDRPRWSVDDARDVLRALRRSGQPVSTFAAEHGLDPQRVYLWRRRLGASAEHNTLQELVVRPTAPSEGPRLGHEPFEVALPSGHVVRVPAYFDDTALARLLDVLARVEAC